MHDELSNELYEYLPIGVAGNLSLGGCKSHPVALLGTLTFHILRKGQVQETTDSLRWRM